MATARDDEIDSWRQNQHSTPEMVESRTDHHGTAAPLIAGAAVAPALADHPAYRNQNQENPFVPTPPPARRTAPNSRAGLTDGVVPGEEPYLTDTKTGRPISSKGTSMHKKSMDATHDHHKAGEIAAVAGAAGLGAAAMHHHNKKKDEDRIQDHGATLPRDDNLTRGHTGHHHNHEGAEIAAAGGLGAAGMHHHNKKNEEERIYDSGADVRRGDRLASEHAGHSHHEGAEIAAAGGLGAAAIHHHNKENRIQNHEAGLLRGDELTSDHRNPQHDHHRAAEIAAVAGAGGLGAAAIHHHDNNNDIHDHEADRLRGDNLSRERPQDREANLPRRDGLARDHEYAQPDHHREAEIAGVAGAGGLGAAALHHHNKNQNTQNHERNLLRGDNLSGQRPQDGDAGLLRGDNLTRDPQRGQTGILRKPETSDHHKGAEIAAAAGAVGLGAAAMHHHDKKKNEERTHEADLLRGNSLISRKPVGSGQTPMSPVSPLQDNQRFSQQPLLANSTPYQDSRVSQPVMPIASATAEPRRSRPSMATTTSNDDPYAFNKVGGRNSSSRSRSRHNSMGREFAAGGAGAALGAAVASRKSHESGRRSMDSDRGRPKSEVPDLPAKTYIGDKVYGIPYHASEQGNPPDVIEAPYQPNSKGLRDWSTSSATRVPTTTESSTLDDQSLTRPATHEGSSSHEPLVAAGAVGAAAGVGAGAIAAHHRDRNSSRSPARPRRRSFHSRVVSHRPDSEPSSSSSGISGVPQPLIGNETQSMAVEPFHSEDLPPTPPTRSRRNSSLGRGAPAAAAGSYLNQDLPTMEAEAERPTTQQSDVPPLPSEMADGVFPVSFDRRGNGRMNNTAAAPLQQQRRPVPNVRDDIPVAPMQSGSNGSPWIPPQQQQQRASWGPARNSFQGQAQAPPPLFTTFQQRSSTPPRLPSRSPRRARFSDPQFPLNTNSRTDSSTSSSTSHGSFTQIPIHHQTQTRVRPSSFDIPSNHPPSAYSTRRSSSSHRNSNQVPPNVDLSDSFDPTNDIGLGGGIVGDNRYPHHGLRSRRNTSDFDEIVPVRDRRPGDVGSDESDDHFHNVGSGSSGREGSSDSASRISAGMPGAWNSGNGSGRRSMSGGRVRLADLRREEEERQRAGYGEEYHGVGQAL